MDFDFSDEIIEPSKKLTPKEEAKKNNPDNYLYNDYTKKYCLKRTFSLNDERILNCSGYNHSSNIVNYLLDKYKDNKLYTDIFLTNLLIVSIELNQIKKMYYILNKKIDINIPDYQGRTPLIMAIYMQRIDIVKMLVEEYGAELNTNYNSTHKSWKSVKNMIDYTMDEKRTHAPNSKSAKKIYDYLTERL